MKKLNISKIFAVIAVLSLFTSCNQDEDVAAIVNVAKPTMTIAIAPTTTVSEGGTVPFTLTLSQPVGEDFNFYVVYQQGSTANGDDSTVTEGLGNTTFQQTFVVPAFTTTFVGEIDVNEDELTEDTETLVINVGDTRTSAVIFQPVTASINITNVVSNELTLDFHFDRSFSGSNGYTSSLCELENTAGEAYDLDFLLWDDTFSDTGNTDAQTAACDESMTISLDDYPDGLYHVISALYTNASLDQAIGEFPLVGAGDFNIPITVDYLRPGGIDKGTFTQESVNWFTASTPEGTLAQVVDVNITTVAGVRKFTIQGTDISNPTIVATGKSKLLTRGKYISKHKK